MASILFIGCSNRTPSHFPSSNGKGIEILLFDEASGNADHIGSEEGIDNPAFLAVSSDGRRLYAVSEVLGWNEGTITAYNIGSNGRLTYLNKQPTRGSVTAHVSLDKSDRFALVANYSVGPMSARPNRAFAVFPCLADGLGPASAEAVHVGVGPNRARQERPHPHSIQTTPDNRFAVVADLGLDRLFVYRFDEQSGRTAAHREVNLPPGSGPRHFAFHPDLPFAYVANELASTVACFAFSAETADFRLIDTVSTVPIGWSGENLCSEITVCPAGQHLYVGNRGHDSIACFAIDAATGRVHLDHTTPCGGRTPRHFAFDPSGGYLLVANQNSDVVAVFAHDAATGRLRPTGKHIATGTPTCIAFARAH